MIIKIKDDGEGLVNGHHYFLGDTSPKRILHHTQFGMGIVSSNRGGIPHNKSYEEFTPEEVEQYRKNLASHKDLKEWVKQHGYGYIDSLGGYAEDYGTENQVDVHEFSLIIPFNPNKESAKDFVDFILETGRRYNQDSVLIAGIPEVADGQARYIYCNSGEEADWFKPQATNVYNREETEKRNDPYYTQIRKGKFNLVFDSESRKNLSNILGVRHLFGTSGAIESKNTGSIILKDL